VAGPVLVYGMAASTLYGIGYWLWMKMQAG